MTRPHRLAGLVLALAAAAGPARADLLTEARIRQAALWRDAALQLEVAAGRRAEAARARDLAQAVAGWRARPETLDVMTEVAAVRPALEAYLSLPWKAETARWPAGEAPGVYALVAREELARARTDFAYAAAAGTSPAEALARGARVYLWTNGQTAAATSFDRLDADVAAAMGGAGEGWPAPAQPPGLDATPVRPAIPAPQPGGGVQGGLRWIGATGDQVGPSGGAPDGRPDAQLEFTFPLAAQPVTMINLSLVDRAGNLCCQTWSTGDARFRFLGVSAPGGAPARAFAPMLGYPPATLRLYAAGTELFAGRMGVQATVVFADGTFWAARTSAGDVATIFDQLQPGAPPPGAPSAMPGSPPVPNVAGYPPQLTAPFAVTPPPGPPPRGAATLAWNGQSADQVGMKDSSADGRPDGTFTFDLTEAQPRTIRWVELVNDKGSRWVTSPAANWYLGVSSPGAGLLNAGGQKEPLGNIGPGTTRLVLHATSDESFRTGNVFTAIAIYDDGTTARASVTIGRPRDYF